MENIKTSFQFYSYDYKVKEEIEESLDCCLSIMGKRSYFPAIFYIVDELASNADKANLKRAHFLKEGLNIDSTKDYLAGIKTFNSSFNFLKNEFIEASKNNNYLIKINIDFNNDKFDVTITNNNRILPIEVSKVNNLINISKSFDTIEEVLKTNIDHSEGSGLGIILTMLTLKKFGFNNDSFKIDCINNFTTAKIEVDFSKAQATQFEKISSEAIKEINEIPQFPQHILEIINILSDPNNNFDMVSAILKKDPALIADLIKTANSTMYILPKRVESIDETVRLLGITTIKNIIITYTVNKIFMNKYNLNTINTMMKHSTETAFYSYEIAKFLRLKNVMDSAFICGMLHDFGKIIIKSLRPDTLEKIEKLSQTREISNFFLEELTSGFNHSIVGFKLAEKWNFPDYIIDSIKYHHIPLLAENKNKNIVFITYLSNALYHYKNHEIKFENINQAVLKTFNLDKKDDFDMLCKGLFTKFENSKNELV